MPMRNASTSSSWRECYRCRRSVKPNRNKNKGLSSNLFLLFPKLPMLKPSSNSRGVQGVWTSLIYSDPSADMVLKHDKILKNQYARTETLGYEALNLQRTRYKDSASW